MACSIRTRAGIGSKLPPDLPHSVAFTDERSSDVQRRWLRLTTPDNGVVCELSIDPLMLWMPTEQPDNESLALTRVDGIGNVHTHDGWRGRGLATWLLERAIGIMRAGDAEWSLLYGIDHFYERWGWASCGDEHWVEISDIDEPDFDGADWQVREAIEDDAHIIHHLYHDAARLTAGAVDRHFGAARAWAGLASGTQRIILRNDIAVGYAWVAGAGSACDDVARKHPDRFVIAELHARDTQAAHGLVRDLLTHANGLTLRVGAPAEHVLRQLGHRMTGQYVDEVRPHGGAMLLDVTTRGRRPPRELYQFLPDRF